MLAISRWAPWVFVFLWSTGFIGSKLGAPYAEPLTFLCVRFAIAAVILTALVPVLKEAWPKSKAQWLHAAVVGILLHGVYLGGVFIAIDRGVDAGLSALIVGLQPCVTVVLAALWLKESVTVGKTLGIIAGLTGVSLVVFDKGLGLQGIDFPGVLFCIAALFGITVGTLYQKRYCTSVPMLSGAVAQYAAVAALLFPLTFMFETRTIVWAPQFIFALLWLILILSLGAVLLLMYLLKHGEAGKVASLFYLVPPLVAVEAWVLFNERLSLVAVAGFVCCVVGVALVVRDGPIK